MMILIRGASEGGAQYLREGHKKGEPLGRLERDTVIPISGSLLLLEQQEKLARDNVEYAGGNYRHATFSFSPRDMAKIDQMSDDERQKFYSDLISDFHAFYLAGYDESEYVSYAEAHRPKTKTQTNWKLGEKEKIEHIHLMTNLFGFDGRQIRFRPFSRLSDDRFQRYLCEKYGLDDPKDFLVQQKPDNDRESLKHFFADVETEADIIELCQNYNIQYKLVETKKNRYYSIQYEGKNYNLRGRDFPACQKATDPDNPTPRVAEKLTGIALEQWVLNQIESRASEIQKRKAGKRIKPQPQQEKPIDIDQIDIEKDAPKDIVLEAPADKDERNYVASAVQAAKVERDDYFAKLGSLDPQLVLDFCRHKNWASTKFEYSIDPAQPTKIQAKNLQNGRTSSVSVGDFLTKPNHCALSFADRVEVVEKLFDFQKKSAPSPLPFEIVISEKVADLYPANEKTGVFDRTGGFSAKKLENMDDLAKIMQEKIYSSSVYRPLDEAEILKKIDEKIDAGKPIPKYLDPKNSILINYGYRDSAHVASHGNVLFFDIDNSLADRARTPVLSIDELSEKVAKSGLLAMIVTTKSHQKPKLESISPQDAEKIKREGIDMGGVELLSKADFCAKYPDIPAPRSDEEGRMFAMNKTDKMRLVVFSSTRFSISKQFADPREQRKYEIQCYEKLRDDVAKHIGILENVDQSTEQDVARIYYPSGQNSIIKKFDAKGLRYFDFATKMQNIEPGILRKIEAEKLGRAQAQTAKTDYRVQQVVINGQKTFEKTYSPRPTTGKEYPLLIDFQTINSLEPTELFKAYDIDYQLRPDKGQEVYDVDIGGRRLLSTARGYDRVMYYDFLNPKDGGFDNMQLIDQHLDRSCGGLFLKIQKLGTKLKRAASAFFKKNRDGVRRFLLEQLQKKNINKQAIEQNFREKFNVKQAMLLKNQIILAKNSFFFDKRDLNLDAADQQKLERISQGLPAIQPVAPTPPPPPPPAPKPQPQAAEPKAQAAAPAPQKKSSSDDFGM